MATRKQPQSTPQPRIVKPKTSSPHEIYIDNASPVCMMNLDRIKDVVEVLSKQQRERIVCNVPIDILKFINVKIKEGSVKNDSTTDKLD